MVLNTYKTFFNKTYNKNAFTLVKPQVIKAKDIVIVHDYKKGNLCYRFQFIENTIRISYFNTNPSNKATSISLVEPFISYANDFKIRYTNSIFVKKFADSRYNLQLQLYGIKNQCQNKQTIDFGKKIIVFKLLSIDYPFSFKNSNFSIRQRFFYSLFLFIITNSQYFWSTGTSYFLALNKIFQQNKKVNRSTNNIGYKKISLFFSINSARKSIRYFSQCKRKINPKKRVRIRVSIKKRQKGNVIKFNKTKLFDKKKRGINQVAKLAQSYQFKLFATNKNNIQPAYFGLKQLKSLLTLITGNRFSLYGINARSFSRFAFDQERVTGPYANKPFDLNTSVSTVNPSNVKTSYRFIMSIEREMLSRFRYVAVYIQDLIRIAFFSRFMKKSAFLATFLAFTLSKLPRNRKETQFIRFLRKLVKVFSSQRKEILGIRIRFQGRVNRWRRTKHIIGEKGAISFYTYDIRMDYGNAQAITRKGALGIRFWIAYQSFFFNTFRIARLKYVQMPKKIKLYINRFLCFLNKLMFQPAFRHFRKINRHHLRNTYENKSCRLCFGTHGIQAVEKGFLTAHQIEAVRRTITGRLKRKGKIWIRAYPDSARTAKPKEVRRGRGKGNVDHWYCAVKPGRILFEIKVSRRYISLLRPALLFARRKLPFFAQIIE